MFLGRAGYILINLTNSQTQETKILTISFTHTGSFLMISSLCFIIIAFSVKLHELKTKIVTN